MNKIKKWILQRKTLIIAGFVVAIGINLAFISCSPKGPEVGTWINQKSKSIKWVFTKNGKTRWYDNDKLFKVFTYKITDEPPVCGKNVKKGKYHKFLQLTSVKDKSKQRCYYINGLTDSTLSLSPFGYSTILFFRKKK